ncbi:translocation/assembly module TamB [Algoriphagus lutimaris]|uniref:translocation/assembly module TamB domain-containing protein n=1 Tax=Algoriphagus lutimaris TaxID=613197 RepID=UPI00196B8F10|nr:translocation/assembly module TamB domain-containing protein [Algoriphagus lutimaris]MBN3521938.1 translocation/assembly module TamB [Algoriphagus lutimaris]
MILLLAVILFIRSPWGQGILVDKAISYLEDKTGAQVGIDRLFVTFSGNIFLENFYISDVNGDTLVYSRNLEAGVAFIPLIQTGAIHVSKFEWEGLKARIKRSEDTGAFNFDYILNSFASTEADSSTIAGSESDSTSLNITLSPISFQDFDIMYQDEVLGIETSLVLGDLKLNIPELDLNAFSFGIEDIQLSKTQIKYKQTKVFPPSEASSEDSTLPIIKIKNLGLHEISLIYDNQVNQQFAELEIDDFGISAPFIDLVNHHILVESIQLSDSKVLFHDFSPSTASSDKPQDSAPFSWPDWRVKLSSLVLENNTIDYKTSDSKITKGVFNPEVLLLEDLGLEISDILLENEKVSLNVKSLSFLEGSGFRVRDLILNGSVGNNGAEINQFFVSTNNSQLKSTGNFTYRSIQQLIDFPEEVLVNLSVDQFSLDVRDSYFFVPDLAKDTLIQELAKAPFVGNLAINGGLSNLEIPSFQLNWGETDFYTKGTVRSPLELDSLYVDFPQIELSTNKNSLQLFVSESDFGIAFPNKIDITAHAKGFMNELIASLDLQTDLGQVLLDAAYKDQELLEFDVNLQVEKLLLGTLLQNSDLDTLSMEINAKGQGSSIYDLTAQLESHFDQLNLYGSDYSGLQLNGQLVEGDGDINLILDSEYLDFDLISSIQLDSINSKVRLNLDLKGADFYKLGFSSKEFRARLKIEGNFEGNPDEFQTTIALSNGLVLYDKKTYPIGFLNLESLVKPDSTSLTIESDIVRGFVQTNTNPSSLGVALENHFLNYIAVKDSSNTELDSGIVMNMDLSIFESPLLNEVLLQGLEQLDSGRVQLAFFQDLDSLDALVSFPYINFSGTEVDSLEFNVHSNLSNLNMELGFLNLIAGPLNMDKTSLTGVMEDSRIYFDFASYNETEQVFHISSDLGLLGDTISFHINPENLLLKKNLWVIPENNQVLYANNNLDFQNFSFSQNGQELSIKKNIEGFTDENIAVLFQNFRLSTFTSLLNPEEILVGGKMNGQLVVENPFGAIGLMGNLKIDSLQAVGVSIGNLSLDATAESLGNYNLALKLRDDGIDLDVNSQFVANESGGEIDLKLDLIKAEMKKIAALSHDQILDASGYLQGTISASGTTSSPSYQGEFQFHETSFVPAQLSTKYILSDEKIQADNDGIYLDQFTVKDTDDNTFIIDGTVTTTDISNPGFDLHLIAKNFMVVNSTNQDNELLYGRGTIDADVTIEGDLNLPIVRANLNVKENTNLTMLIPESQLDLVERDGVVLFVNKENPDDILTSQTEQSTTAFLGYDIQASLKTDPKAKFTVIIDPKTGDNLLISGSANLRMDITPNGRITLSGDYEISNGHYEMSLYNLISKKFLINPGSRITWNGDPMDANMDIRAIYEVDASASALMSSQLTGSSQSTKSQYQRRLPFLVYLNVDGELLRPEISFALDMPENERGAFGGNVYSQVLQINDQEDELNKQVFSLLVLNRFFPSRGSDGSNGGAETIARSSASQILSDQMNALSSKLFGDSGFQLGFDVDTYEDYQSGSSQNRTDLNINAQQTLFNDRLIVEVGSQVGLEGSSQEPEQSNAILANVSFEYILTEDGRWRIRVFRKNQYESIIDGQLVVTGGGLIFNREFNEFYELWKKAEKMPEESKTMDSTNKGKEENEK